MVLGIRLIIVSLSFKGLFAERAHPRPSVLVSAVRQQVRSGDSAHHQLATFPLNSFCKLLAWKRGKSSVEVSQGPQLLVEEREAVSLSFPLPFCAQQKRCFLAEFLWRRELNQFAWSKETKNYTPKDEAFRPDQVGNVD